MGQRTLGRLPGQGKIQQQAQALQPLVTIAERAGEGKRTEPGTGYSDGNEDAMGSMGSAGQSQY